MTVSHPDTEQKFRKKVKSTEEKKKKKKKKMYPATKYKTNRTGHQHVATPIYLVSIT